MKVLIIGFGSIGKRHAEILSSFQNIDDIHIVSKQENLKYISFKSLEEVPEINNYDYFVISSITSLHLSQLKYLDKYVSKKSILVEKPLTTKYTNFKVRNKVFIAYNLRFHPMMQELYNILLNEKVLSINIQTGQYLPTWRPERDYSDTYSASIEKGGGVLLDLSHEIDYLLWLFGDIVSFNSISEKISDLNIETEDMATAIGKMKSGAIFSISIDYISKILMRRIIINTISKTIDADLIKNELSFSDKSCQRKYITIPPIERNTSYREMHRQILEPQMGINPTTLEEGLKVQLIIDKMKEGSYES